MPTPRYVKGKDGKFLGSIGDGKTNVPTSAPKVQPAKTKEPSTPQQSIADYWNNFDHEAFSRRMTAAEKTITLKSAWGEDVQLENGIFNEDAEYVFSEGHCHSFALALHEHTNLPLIGRIPIVDEDADEDDLWDPNMKYLNHVAVMTDENTVLDANGIHTLDEWAGPYDLQTFDSLEDLRTEMNRINDLECDEVWVEPRVDAAILFVVPALQKYAPGLIRE